MRGTALTQTIVKVKLCGYNPPCLPAGRSQRERGWDEELKEDKIMVEQTYDDEIDLRINERGLGDLVTGDWGLGK